MSVVDRDFFELFGIDVTFRPDESMLKRTFYKLSRTYHPDHFTTESEEKQQEALLMSGIINTAYNVLNDENARMKYILERYHLLKGTENEALPQDFLMHMMDINEAIFDLQMAPDSKVLSKVLDELNTLENQLKSEADQWIDDFENQRDINSALENLKYYYLKSKYLLRIRENLSTFALS